MRSHMDGDKGSDAATSDDDDGDDDDHGGGDDGGDEKMAALMKVPTLSPGVFIPIPSSGSRHSALSQSQN